MARRAGSTASRAFVAARHSRYWREADARVVVVAYRRSGLSLAAFARQTGLSARRIGRWRERVSAPAAPAAPTFLPVEVVTAPAAPGRPLEVVAATGHVVRVPVAFDATTLTRLLAVLAGAPC